MSNQQLEVAMKVKLALEEFQRNLASMGAQFDQAMAGMQGDAKDTGNAMETAFKTLGIRSVREVEAEIEKLQGAMATLRASKMLPADAERASAALNAKLAGLRAEMAGVAVASPAAASGVRQVAAASDNAANSLGAAATKAGAWVAAMVGINQLAGLAADVINTGAAFETLEGRLTSLLGSQEAAQEAFSDLKDLAATTPFEVEALTEAYAKLTAFGLQPSMDQMLAMADTAATLGGGTETLSGVTTALGQAWAKGRLQGEEILQMAEQGVPVWAALEQATGKNEQELQKLAAAGQLGRDVILKLIDALGQQNMGASEKLMATYAGAVSNAHDALSEFYSMIASSGVLEYLTAQIREVLAEFERMKDTGELQEKAKAIATTFLDLAEASKVAFEAISTLVGFADEALAIFAANRLIAFVGALRSIQPAAVMAGTGLSGLAGQAVAAEASVAATTRSVGLLAGGLRILRSLTVAGLITEAVSLGAEFFRAKRAAEESDEAVRQMLRPVQVNGPAVAVKEIATEAEAAKYRLSEVEKEFRGLVASGKSAGDALGEVVKAAKIDDPEGIAKLVKNLGQLYDAAQVTGEQIQTALVDRLKGMTAKDLSEFGIMAEMAFNRGEMAAIGFASVLDAQARSALQNLGVDADVALTGMSDKFVEAQGNLGILIGQYDTLKAKGVDAASMLQQALEAALKSAENPAELKALAVEVKRVGDHALIAKKKVAELLDDIARKSDKATEGINSVNEAMKSLGLKSDTELKKTAASFHEAYLAVKTMGGSVREQEAAFKVYAQAALDANKGVASDALRVEAAMAGVRMEVDATGKVIMSSMTSATPALSGVADEADRAGRGANTMANGFDKAATAAQRLHQVKQQPSAGRGKQPGTTLEGSEISPEDKRLGRDKSGIRSEGINWAQMAVQYDIGADQLEQFSSIASRHAQLEWGKLIGKQSHEGDTEAVLKAAAEAASAEVKKKSWEENKSRAPVQRMEITLRGPDNSATQIAADDPSAFLKMIGQDARRV